MKNETFVNSLLNASVPTGKIDLAAVQAAIQEKNDENNRAKIERARNLFERLNGEVTSAVESLRIIRQQEKEAKQTVIRHAAAFATFKETGDLNKVAAILYPGEKIAQENFVRRYS